jgi:hypothetical protein
VFIGVTDGVDDVDENYGDYGGYKDKWDSPLCYLGQLYIGSLT